MSASTYWTPTRSASPAMQIAVGQVARAHGIRGEVIVGVRTDEPGLRFAPGATLAADPPDRGPLTVRASRWHSGRLIVAFEGIADRTEAEGLRGTLLLLDSEQIPSPADPDEFYDHQLIGLGVVTAAGDPVGVVADVLHHGQDLLVVRPEGSAEAGGPGPAGRPGVAGCRETAGPDEVLVPFVGAIVTDVDVAGGRLVIDPPPGLLNPEDAVRGLTRVRIDIVRSSRSTSGGPGGSSPRESGGVPGGRPRASPAGGPGRPAPGPVTVGGPGGSSPRVSPVGSSGASSPRVSPAGLSMCRSSARRRPGVTSNSTCTTCAAGRTTSTRPWTTRRSAAVPAW